MEAEAKAVTIGDLNTGGGGSGVDKDTGDNSDGGCTDKNNQQSTKSGGSHCGKNNDYDSNDNDNNNNDGDGSGGDGGRRWQWAL
jgi:hypothetical protein